MLTTVAVTLRPGSRTDVIAETTRNAHSRGSAGRAGVHTTATAPWPHRLEQIAVGEPVSAGALVQRRVAIDADAAPNDRQAVQAVLATVASYAAIRDARDVDLTITVLRSDEGGDAVTHAQWSSETRRSSIDIVLEMRNDEPASMIQAALLHELHLHALPAYGRHQAAHGGDPGFTHPESDEFEAEEAEEHTSIVGWQATIAAATRLSQAAWLETIKDAIRHLLPSPDEYDPTPSDDRVDFIAYGEQLLYFIRAYDPDFAALYLGDLESEDEEEGESEDDRKSAAADRASGNGSGKGGGSSSSGPGNIGSGVLSAK